MDDDFRPVRELNRTQRKISASVQRGIIPDYKGMNGVHNGNIECINVDVAEDNIIRRLNAAVSHMKEDDYFSSFIKVLEEALTESEISLTQIVCYGLGSFGNNMTSRYQLAFLILLKEKLTIPVQIFDPTFTQNEIKVMKSHLNFKVLNENEEGNRFVDEFGIIFYMPHAPHQLVNNLLFTNWYSNSISKCICICNSFTNLKLNFPKKVLQNNLGYIDRSEKIVVEYGIINTFPYKDIFNDMALHAFPLRKINELHLPKDYWERSLKPVYRQLEFIRAKTDFIDGNKYTF